MVFRILLLLIYLLASSMRVEAQDYLLGSMKPKFYEWNYTSPVGRSKILPAYNFFFHEEYAEKNIKKVMILINDANVAHTEILRFDNKGRIIEFDYTKKNDANGLHGSTVLFKYIFRYKSKNHIAIQLDSFNINAHELSPVRFINLFYGQNKKVDSAQIWTIDLSGDTVLYKKYTTSYDHLNRLLKVDCSTYDYIRKKKR